MSHFNDAKSAILNSKDDELLEIIKNHPEVLKEKDDQFNTELLFFAAGLFEPGYADYFLNQGQDPNLESSFGMTPFTKFLTSGRRGGIVPSWERDYIPTLKNFIDKGAIVTRDLIDEFKEKAEFGYLSGQFDEVLVILEKTLKQQENTTQHNPKRINKPRL